MTYLDLINRFWSINGKEPFGANDIALYFYILKECNRLGWPEPFEISNRNLCLGLGIAESTMLRARNRLKQRGVLDFEPGKKRASSPLFYLQNESKNGGKNDGKNGGKNDGKNGGKNDGKNGGKNDGNNKNKDYKIKDNLSEARARTRKEEIAEKSLADFLSIEKLASREQFAMSNHCSMQQVENAARDVCNDWILGAPPNTSEDDIPRAFLYAVRKKLQFTLTDNSSANPYGTTQTTRPTDAERRQAYTAELNSILYSDRYKPLP